MANSYPSRIIPQAVCVRYGLHIGAQCVPIVSGLMYMLGERDDRLYRLRCTYENSCVKLQSHGLWPSCWIGFLARASRIHTRKPSSSKSSCSSMTDDILILILPRSLLSFHGEGAGPLVAHELTILNGVLELSSKTAEAIMTPISVNSITDLFAGDSIVLILGRSCNAGRDHHQL